MTATVHSLTSEKGAQLNGKECNVEGYDPVSMRYACKFREGEPAIKLKAANLCMPCSVDRDEVFKILPILGKGLGVIAQKPIAKLARVIVEKPILESSFQSKDNDLDPADIMGKFDRLADEDKEAVLSLANYNSIAKDYRLDGTDADDLQSRIQGIIETNVLGGKIDEEDKKSMRGIALCLKISRLNHSCSPNCEWRYNSNIDELPCVYALRDIEAGEELTLSYVLVTQSRKGRRSELQRYNFTCGCEACKSTDQDAGREVIEQAMMSGTKDVGALEGALSNMRDLGLALPMYEAMFNKKLSEAHMRKGDDQKALAAAEKAAPVLESIYGAKSLLTRDVVKTLKELGPKADK